MFSKRFDIFKTLFKSVRDNARPRVNTEGQINRCQAEFSTCVIAPNVVPELWPVKQQMSNMIRYFYGSELNCPLHTVNIYTLMVNTWDIPGQNFTAVPVYITFISFYVFMLLTWSTSPLSSFTFFYSLCLSCTKTQFQLVKDYLAKNVVLMRAPVCSSYMPGQYIVQTQVV